MSCVCYCHGHYDQSADLCDHCRLPSYGELLEALRGMVICVSALSDPDLDALGIRRDSVCLVEARRLLARIPQVARSSGDSPGASDGRSGETPASRAMPDNRDRRTTSYHTHPPGYDHRQDSERLRHSHPPRRWSLAEFLPKSEQDAYLEAVHAADMGDGHGHAPEDCPDNPPPRCSRCRQF